MNRVALPARAFRLLRVPGPIAIALLSLLTLGLPAPDAQAGMSAPFTVALGPAVLADTVSVSENGSVMAYTAQSPMASGRLVVFVVKNGRTYKIARSPFGSPVVSGDGRRVLVSRITGKPARMQVVRLDLATGKTLVRLGYELWGGVSATGRYAVVRRRGKEARPRKLDAGILDTETGTYTVFPQAPRGLQPYPAAINSTGSCAVVPFSSTSGRPTPWSVVFRGSGRVVQLPETESVGGRYGGAGNVARVSTDCMRISLSASSMDDLRRGERARGRIIGLDGQPIAQFGGPLIDIGDDSAVSMSSDGRLVAFSCRPPSSDWPDEPFVFFLYDTATGQYSRLGRYDPPSGPDGIPWNLELTGDGSTVLVRGDSSRALFRAPVAAATPIGTEPPGECFASL